MSSLSDLPDWVKSLGLPKVATEAIDRYWKPVWDDIKHELDLLPAHRDRLPAPAEDESIAFAFIEELEPGERWRESFEVDVARLPGLVPQGGPAGPARHRHLPEDAALAHAGADAHLRAPGRADRERRAGRPLPLALPAPRLRGGLLPGRLDRRGRPGAGAQLRLPGVAVRGARVLHGLDRPPCDRDERLPLGPARRRERRRPGRLADLRRPPRRGGRLRDPAGDPLPARGVHQRGRGARGAGRAARARRPERDPARQGRRLRHRLPEPRSGARLPRRAGGHQPPAPRRLARIRRGGSHLRARGGGPRAAAGPPR